MAVRGTDRWIIEIDALVRTPRATRGGRSRGGRRHMEGINARGEWTNAALCGRVLKPNWPADVEIPACKTCERVLHLLQHVL